MATIKKVPLRKCSGCNEQFPKKELIRVVRTPNGEVVVDLTGKADGRGVYLCKNGECLKKTIKAKRLDRSLEVKVPDEIYSELEALTKETDTQ